MAKSETEEKKTNYTTIIVITLLIIAIIILCIWGYMTSSTSENTSNFTDYFFAKKIEEENIFNRTPIVENIKDIDFKNFNVGGLSEKTKEDLKKIIYIRSLPDDLKKNLNVRNIKGILLHGPPGCGKTLIAREVAALLGAESVKVVSGPDILNKYVGESEKNVRDMFKDAEQNPNRFYAIICDEFDSIAKKRDSITSDCSTHGNVVNQLLSKLDGIHSLNNIIFICTTNNMSAIDPAILRSGRIEMLIEIKMPDLDGRKEIFSIHLNKINKLNKKNDIDIDYLASKTNDFSGADIQSVVDIAKMDAIYRNTSDVIIENNDLLKSIESINNQKINNVCKDNKECMIKKLANLVS